MSVNVAHTADGRGVLIYNGEMILLYTKEVDVSFSNSNYPAFHGKKVGNLYLTSHRIIFINRNRDALGSFSLPFHCIRNLKLEQPVFGANYLKGTALAQPGGNWEGEVTFKLTFNKGGCIDFGQALLKAAEMGNTSQFQAYGVPPPYSPPPPNFYQPQPAFYTPRGNNYNGFQAPTNVFPDQPPAGNVFMYDAPPPYTGIGPNCPPVPAGQLGQVYPTIPNSSDAPPSYDQASAIPEKR
uniref:GRAM domain-containing protein n=1 Tax=Syphacia muris TaxID=451379 RepID=A0A0N5AX96_9BILA